jgi:hypothetical protein
MVMSNVDRYIIARWCYAIGEDFIDDIEYRNVEDLVRREDPNNEYLKRSWSDDPCPIELLQKYGRTDLYRDIKFEHKSESIRSINTMTEFEDTFKYLSSPSRLSFKADGWNIQVNYYNGKPISAETRGRGGNSLNADLVRMIVPQQIPLMGRVKVTGETVIPNSKWPLFLIEFSLNTSQRSSVVTCLSNNRPEYLQFVAFNIQSEDTEILGDIYDVLTSYGFTTPYRRTVNNYAQLCSAMKLMERVDKNYDIPNDGLVIENSSYQLAIRVGHWQEEVMQSYVTEYLENHGAYGNAMKVGIKPVVYNGGTRRQVSVTNLQYILDSNLQIGAPIAFDIRSEATAVLNQTKTDELQQKWAGKYSEYREMIDRSVS